MSNVQLALEKIRNSRKEYEENNPSDSTNESAADDSDLDENYVPDQNNSEESESSTADDGRDEFSATVPSSSTDIHESTASKIKRSRKSVSNREEWKKNQRKKSRIAGKEYCKVDYKKTGEEIKRSAKKVQNIDCSKCRNKCNEKISQEQRENLFASFYNLNSYARQQDYICGRILKQPVDRRSTTKGVKKASFKYSFIVNDETVSVCKRFFLATLDISEKRTCLAMARKSEDGTFAGDDNRGRHTPANKIPEETLHFVRQHIESYPAVESHYVRKDSQKKYLAADLNVNLMYRQYCEFCTSNNLQPVSSTRYREVFHEYNFAFHRPKKDQCSTCTKYAMMNDAEKVAFQDAYNEHLARKTRAQSEKATDKERAASDKTFVSVTFDLQSVLHTPCSEVSVLYYKRKFSVYNFTVFEQALPHNGFCFMWTEIDAKRGATEIASCLYLYLSRLSASVKEISMFSDCCTGQNRNQYVAVALLHAARTIMVDIIEQKFLEPGHTYMECDSMHSCIEKAKKHKNVFIPKQWLPIISAARPKNPFHITSLKRENVTNWPSLASEIMPVKQVDNKKEKLRWNAIKVLRFEKQFPDVIRFKYNFDDNDYRVLKVSGQGLSPVLAYDSYLPVSDAKKKDLVSLCTSGVIPEDCRKFYYDLPTGKDVRDALPEPDVDDNSDASSVY